MIGTRLVQLVLLAVIAGGLWVLVSAAVLAWRERQARAALEAHLQALLARKMAARKLARW